MNLLENQYLKIKAIAGPINPPVMLSTNKDSNPSKYLAIRNGASTSPNPIACETQNRATLDFNEKSKEMDLKVKD